jgi:wyosine [tRNA(Phe)-imidazoG37] synthetase (radical SAM superfamily)
MKAEEFKDMVREIIRAELKSIMHPSKDHQDPHKDPHLAHEEICEGEGCLDEKSVPQPYDRKSARKMTKSQVDLRKKIGQAMMRDEKKVSKFRKEYGDDWKDYLWAAASSAAFRQSGSTKSDDKKKK